MKIKLNSFTPLYDSLAQNERYGVIGGIIFGRIERLSHKFGYCFASKESIGDMLNLSIPTIRKYVDRLIDDKYIEDMDEGIRNRPHRLRPTGKLQLEIQLGSVEEEGSNEVSTSEEGSKNFPSGSNEVSTLEEEGSNEVSMNKESFNTQNNNGDLTPTEDQVNFEYWKQFTLKPDAPTSSFQAHIEPLELVDITGEKIIIRCRAGDSGFIQDRCIKPTQYRNNLYTYLGIYNLEIEIIEEEIKE